MSSPIYNALAGKGVLPNKPVVDKAPTPAQATKTATPAGPGPNSRPNKDANAGQSPAMTGDRQRITRPPTPAIASTAPARHQEQRSGMESAMGAMADQMHPVKRRGG